MSKVLPFRSALSATALLLVSTAVALHAQESAPVAPVLTASLELPASSSSLDLPSAPSAMLAAAAEGQAGVPALTTSPGPIAPKYSGIVLHTQSARPLSAGDKVKFGFVQAISPVNIVAWGISSAYSQGVDSAPHYGQGWGPFGQRYGAAAARGTIQTLATDSLLAPIFHDDPRYYELGRQHKLVPRAIYAATRTVITRGDNGRNRVNLPLLIGYAGAAGATNAFYPQRDQSGSQTAYTFAGSVGGAALGFLFDEFLDDGLRIVHLRK